MSPAIDIIGLCVHHFTCNCDPRTGNICFRSLNLVRFQIRYTLAFVVNPQPTNWFSGQLYGSDLTAFTNGMYYPHTHCYHEMVNLLPATVSLYQIRGCSTTTYYPVFRQILSCQPSDP